MHTNTKWSADMLYMTVENYYKKISEMKLAEILFYTFPLSFIVGNFALSLHLILFIVSSLFLIKKENLTTRFKSFYWFLIAFFFYFFSIKFI